MCTLVGENVCTLVYRYTMLQLFFEELKILLAFQVASCLGLTLCYSKNFWFLPLIDVCFLSQAQFNTFVINLQGQYGPQGQDIPPGGRSSPH